MITRFGFARIAMALVVLVAARVAGGGTGPGGGSGGTGGTGGAGTTGGACASGSCGGRRNARATETVTPASA